MLEVVRKIMKEGDPGNGLHPIEPLRLENNPFEFHLRHTELAGFLKETVIEHPSDFQVAHLTVDTSPKEARLKVLFEKIEITGLYKILGILFGDFPVNGLGTYEIKVKNLVASAEADYRSKAGILRVTNLNATFDLDGISILYKNILESDEVRAFEEKFISHLLYRFRTEYLPLLVETSKILINHFIERLVKREESVKLKAFT